MPAERNSRRPARREVSAGGVVFRRSPKGLEVVLIKAGDRWSFPKGSIEKGESDAAAALREIAEETGLPQTRLRIQGRLPDIEYAFVWGETLIFKTVRNFLVRLTGESPFNPQLSEIEEVAWFTPEAAFKAIGFKNARETLGAALAAVDEQEKVS